MARNRLNNQEILFAEALIRGEEQWSAYRALFTDDGRKELDQKRSMATLQRRPAFRAYFEKRLASVQHRTEVTADEVVGYLRDVAKDPDSPAAARVSAAVWLGRYINVFSPRGDGSGNQITVNVVNYGELKVESRRALSGERSDPTQLVATTVSGASGSRIFLGDKANHDGGSPTVGEGSHSMEPHADGGAPT